MALHSEIISNLAHEIGSTNFSRLDSGIIVPRLAVALGWQEESAQVTKIETAAVGKSAYVGKFGNKTGIVIATSQKSKIVDTVRDAALYAYHSDAPWGAVVTSDDITIFNSHWIYKNSWYKIKLKWDYLSNNQEALSILQPQNIISNHSESLASRILQPDRVILNVDDALVRRLEYWRYQALRYIRSTERIDEKVQGLFAQLFVLRMLEDRKLIPEIESLSAYTSTGDVKRAVTTAFGNANAVVSDELFNENVIDLLPDDILRGIISDLYYPQHLPLGSQVYNFSWIDADLLGATYEKYLGSIYSEAPLSNQPSLFMEPERELSKATVRKQSGSYYTPSFLVDYIIDRSFQDYYKAGREKSHIEDLPRVADIACGSGSFLLAAARKLLAIGNEIDPSIRWADHIVKNRLIVGIDIDERATNLARLSLWIRFAQENDPLPLPHLSDLIVTGDSLSSATMSNLGGKFDIVVGNPPFIANPKSTSVDYEKTFYAAKGRYDFSYLFVEQAVNYLNDGGIMGFVLPNRIFKNRDAASIREFLNTNTKPLEVIDFNSSKIFKDASAYIGVIISERSARSIDDLVKVINVLDVSSEFFGEYLRSAAKAESYYNNNIEAFKARLPLGELPWLFVSPGEQEARIKLSQSDYTVGALCGVYQGIKTGANDIFVVSVVGEADNSSLVSAVNGFGESLLIERDLLNPVAFGPDLQKFSLIGSDKLIIYPYRNDELISLDNMIDNYPLTYQYLLRYESILRARSGIDPSRWYDLTRKREQSWLRKPKLAMKDLGRETQFAIDYIGDTYIIGGTIIVPSDESLIKTIAGYINSSLANSYISRSAPSFRGGYVKIEPANIKALPIPAKLVDDASISNRMGLLVDALVASEINSDNYIKALKEIDDLIDGSLE